MMLESKEAGEKTLGMLDEQGEKLDNAERDLDGVKNNMKEANAHLSTLERFWGMCTLFPWNKKQSPPVEEDATFQQSKQGLLIIL